MRGQVRTVVLRGFLPVLLLAGLASAGSSCASAPPNLSAHATQSWHKTRIIKGLDVVRDIAIDGSAQTPPVISKATAGKVVIFHKSALDLIAASDTGWQALVSTALDDLLANLTPAEKQQLGPYVALAKTLLQEVATDEPGSTRLNRGRSPERDRVLQIAVPQDEPQRTAANRCGRGSGVPQRPNLVAAEG